MFGLVPFRNNNSLARPESSLKSLFDVFNEPFFQSGLNALRDLGASSFKVDVKDEGDRYTLHADLPGTKKEDISLSYEDSYLTIATKTQTEKDEKDDEGRYIRRERSYGNASRSFYINDIDKEKIDAAFADGVLTITLPKLAEATPPAQQITIR
ncbi:Hsp20/alpha crystallin family protein [Selenomonas sp. TAMA-11512]|uniref:Hsp20/alpha crystallin family protein n=1 Tax=Selenomonas sp. TAMA-11512 TaxID=3095337 RepID=UPI00309102FB|nr:Hsp20/alpha crystallin family protein [Selenomonas sp. TAMA-11512]